MRSNGSGGTPAKSTCSRPVLTLLRHLCDALLAATLAPRCALCDQLLDHPIDGPVCPRCWRAVEPLTPPVCRRCGDPLSPGPGETARCRRCRGRSGPLSQIRAVGVHRGVLRRVVHLFKYEGRPGLAAPLGALMRREGAAMPTWWCRCRCTPGVAGHGGSTRRTRWPGSSAARCARRSVGLSRRRRRPDARVANAAATCAAPSRCGPDGSGNECRGRGSCWWTT